MRLIEGQTLKEAIDRFYGEFKKPPLTPNTPKGTPLLLPFFRVFRVFRGSFHPLLLQSGLAFRQLLNRFLTVCQTIAYAHSRGIVHRDLKPANIILGKYGETIVVDWGLAKAVDHPEGAGPMETRPGLVHGEDSVPTKDGQIVGTPQYMSPEQAAGRLDQVGPSSDIYGLGATLYCLLTGAPPFTDPRETTVEAVLQQVQQGSFRRPRQIQTALPRALEAICLKALALRPQDRYPSAQALADDLDHWLADEPVTAYREPRRTRMARWLRRHRALSAGLAVLAATGLLALLFGTALLARSKARAETAQRRAETAEATTSAINRFLTEDLLAAPRPEQQRRDVTVKQALDAAAVKLDQVFAGQPEVEAAVRQTIGRTYYKLGLYSDAEPHIRKALDLCGACFGPEHRKTLEARKQLVEFLLLEDKQAEAEPLLDQNLEACRRVLGPEDAETLEMVTFLGILLANRGKFREMEPLLRENLAACRRVLGPEDPQTLNAVNSLGQLLVELGQLTEAEPLLRQSLEAQRRLRGPEHPWTLNAVNSLAKLLWRRGQLAEAEPLLRQNLEARQRVFGPEHLRTLSAVNNLARVLQEQGKLSEAEPLLRQTLEARRRICGPEHPLTLGAIGNFAFLLHQCGRLSEAEPLLQELLETRARVHGMEHLDTLAAAEGLAWLSKERGKRTEAETLFREILSRRDALPLNHNVLESTLAGLGQLLSDSDRMKEAEPLLRECVEIRRKTRAKRHELTAEAESALGACLAKLGTFEEAELLLLSSFEVLKSAQGGRIGPLHKRRAAYRVADLYNAWGQPEKAAEWRAKGDEFVKPADQPKKE